MATKKQAVPFSGTPQQEEQLQQIIQKYKDEKGALMPVLQLALDN